MNAIVGFIVGIFLTVVVYEAILPTPVWFLMNEDKLMSGEPYPSKEMCEMAREDLQESFYAGSKEFWERVGRRSAQSTEGAIKTHDEHEAIVRTAYCGSRRM